MPTRALLIAIVATLSLLAVPAAASAYNVTVYVHGAGGVDETTPASRLHCVVGPGEPDPTACTIGGYGWAWTVRLVASVPPEYAALGWQFTRWVDGDGPGLANCDPTSVVGTRYETDCQFGVFENVSLHAYFRDVAGPQATTLAGGPTGTTNTTTASFTFDSEDPTAGYQCKLDRPGQAGEWAACGTPTDKSETYTGLTANGSYLFAVRGRDAAGNLDRIPATRSWTVDTVAPQPTITGGWDNDALVNVTTAAFAVATNEGQLECGLDGAPLTPCQGIRSFQNLADGRHTFRVRATDAAGNIGAATRSWTVDTQPPAKPVLSGVWDGAITDLTTARFTVSGQEAGTTLRCSLDSPQYETCTSPVTYTSLSEGSHLFVARLVDAAGNMSDVEARRWVVNATEPETTIVDGPAEGSTSGTDVRFAFASSESGTFRCLLDDAAGATPCESPLRYSSLAPGRHTLLVYAVDAYGRPDGTPATRTWTVATPPPTEDPKPPPSADPKPAPADPVPTTPADPVTPADPPPLTPSEPVAPKPQVAPGVVVSRFKVTGRTTVVKRLRVSGLARGSTVTLSCTGARCPLKVRTAKAADLRPLLRGRPLRAGSTLRVTIAARGYATRTVTFAIRRGKQPRTL